MTPMMRAADVARYMGGIATSTVYKGLYTHFRQLTRPKDVRP